MMIVLEKSLYYSKISDGMYDPTVFPLVDLWGFGPTLKSDKPKNDSIFKDIRSWADTRGLYNQGDVKTQLIKLYEESGELSQAILKNDKAGIIDAIGDSVVVLTNLAHLVGTDIETCINSAYSEISDRTGRMINGTFVKDE